MAKTTYRLVEVPFSKTECGVDFFINTAHGSERRGVLTEYPVFKTDFFEMFFFRKANGYLLLGYQKIELRDDMVLILKPHQQQEWHIDEDALDYDFLIFRNDFMRTFIADKFFVYRLQYCQQTDTPPYFMATADELTEYERLLKKIRSELRQPVADSYHIIVSVLYYLLAVLNRRYTETYSLPFELPKNHYAFLFVELMEQHIRDLQRVQEYADLMHVSRVTLNQSVMAQYGVPATVLLKQRLLAEIKNGLLFSHKTVSEIAYDFHFSEPSHLMRFFKKATGKTCTQFQQEYENGTFE
ncbi:MAG: helix-turn-helix transcriptional regulator [Bacteroidaceae bacterium]|nr:helix-turn-helix transcriptional regulator [Bacteroidaceae bacterium]